MSPLRGVGSEPEAVQSHSYGKPARKVPRPRPILRTAALAGKPFYITSSRYRSMVTDYLVPMKKTYALLEGLYPYARTLFLYTNPKTETRPVKNFIRFIQSRDGQRPLAPLGFVPRIHIPFEREGLAL